MSKLANLEATPVQNSADALSDPLNVVESRATSVARNLNELIGASALQSLQAASKGSPSATIDSDL